MGIATKAGNEINGWIKLAIVIVIGSVVLLKFKSISGVTSGLNTTIDAFVSAFSEPSNWVAIAIIALIGAGMLYYFNKQKGGM